MGSRASWFVVVAGAIVAGLVLVSCIALIFGAFVATKPGTRPAPSRGHVSNGQRIYFRGTNERGERIRFEGGPMWLNMRGGSCATCHGSDGRGGVPVMMGTEVPGDIRYHHLTEEEHEEGEEHPPFTDESIKRAITQGVNPAGEPLDRTMPRWRMSDQDLDDLLDFLKTLDE